jgi:hypothetical protein
MNNANSLMSIVDSFQQSTSLTSFTNEESTIHDSFLIKYANKDFLSKFLNICLYQADFSSIAGIGKNTEIIKHFKMFLNSVADDVKHSSSINIQQKPLISSINMLKRILDIKEDPAARLLTYDTVDKHFQNLDIFSSKIVETVKNNRISNFQTFKSELDDLHKLIQVYTELKQVKLISEELDFLRQDSVRTDSSPLNLLKNYKNVIQKAYSIFSTLKSVSNEDELEKCMVFYDESGTDSIINSLFKYLSKSFNFYKTGYKLLDDNVEGLESSSVYLISAASNNGKSLFMINMLRNVILEPSNKFEPNDMLLFVTLEDDIYKVFRRFLSIFGNISTKLAKKLFVHCASIIQETKDIDIKFKNTEQEIKQLLSSIIKKTIYTATKGRCRFALVYSNNQDYTALDISKFIDKQKAEGINVKAVFIDYLDYMLPSNASIKDKEGSQYSAHGQIVKELKLVGREYGIPIVTVNFRRSLNYVNSVDLLLGKTKDNTEPSLDISL